MSSGEQLSRADLQDAAVSGVRWIVVARILAETSALLSSVAVARLLTPAEFGHAAPAAFVFALAASLPIGSFGSVLVQSESVDAITVRTAFMLSAIGGVLVTALVIGAAPVWRLVLPDESVGLIQLVAPCFLLFSIASVPLSLLQRELDFRRTSMNEVVSFLPSVVATVAGAAAGLGGEAIVLGFLVQGLLMCAQALWWRQPPRPGFSRAAAGRILRFGGPTSATTMLHTSQRNIAVAILSAQLSASAVGFYWRAQQLAVDYQGKASGIILRLLFPLLSRAASERDLRAVRGRMVTIHAALLFPALALLAVLAPIAVPLIYGEPWADAALAAQILVVAGFVAVVNTGTGPVLLALGRPRPLMVYNAATLAGSAATLIVVSPYGLTATCIAVSAFQVINLLAAQYLLMHRLVGITLWDTLVRDTLPAFVGSIALVAVAWPASIALERAGAPDLATIAAATAGGLLAYALVLRQGFGDTWRDLATLAERVLPGRRRAAAGPATGTQAAEPPTSPA